MASEIDNVMLLQTVINELINDYLNENDKFPCNSVLSDEDEITYTSVEYFLIDSNVSLFEYSDTVKLMEKLKNSGVIINSQK